MKGTSKMIMAATLVMLVSLGIVLGLVLVLLAELYCSLLLHQRRCLLTTSSTTGVANNAPQSQQSQQQSASLPVSSFYAHGVLQAPRSVLFPSVSGKDKSDVEKQRSAVTRVSDTQSQEFKYTTHEAQHLLHSSFVSATSPQLVDEKDSHQDVAATFSKDKAGCVDKEHIIYISNPIYDNEIGQPSGLDTQFEMPDTCTSHLGTGNSPSEDDKDRSAPSSSSSVPNAPPLTPMKKLPVVECSVYLRDARCLGSSGSDSNSNNGLSSSTSGSPCTSPSW